MKKALVTGITGQDGTIMVDSDLEAAGRNPVGVGKTILASNFSQWHQWSCAVTPLHQNDQLRF
jgi:GDP-D-mannose dehydratase